jgi:isobutyryl-CoA mutase
MLYEQKKQDGTLPMVGINTFRRESEADESISPEVIRATDEEKQLAIANLHRFQEAHKNESSVCLRSLRASVKKGSNIFNELMQTVKYCSLGEITQALYETGGQYRRNM